MTFLAAIKDPETGRVFTGRSHGLAIDSALRVGPAMARRVLAVIAVPGSPFQGFVDDKGNFYSRQEAKAKFGFSTSQEMWAKQPS